MILSRSKAPKLSIEILADSVGDLPRFVGQSSLGFAEIKIMDPQVEPLEEVIRLPEDLLRAAGKDSDDHPLAISLTRQRQDPSDPTRGDEETSIRIVASGVEVLRPE